MQSRQDGCREMKSRISTDGVYRHCRRMCVEAGDRLNRREDGEGVVLTSMAENQAAM